MLFPYLIATGLCLFLGRHSEGSTDFESTIGPDLQSDQRVGEGSPYQSTLDAIERSFAENYCFVELDHSLFGWDSHAEMNGVRRRIADLGSVPPLNRARESLYYYFDSTRDVHVQPVFATDSPYVNSRLPIAIRSANDDHYVLVAIDRAILSESAYPFEIGDELVSLDGRPVRDAVATWLPKRYAQAKTQTALAERYALSVYEQFGRPVPSGFSTVRVRSRLGGYERTYSLPWKTKNKASAPTSRNERPAVGKASGFISPEAFDRDSPSRSGNAVVTEPPISNYGRLGPRNAFFAPLGPILWSTGPDDPFQAYLFRLPDGGTGAFIRVSTYFPNQVVGTVLPFFYGLIDRFVQAQAKVLVFDQTNNAGGALLYGYDLLSALIDHPVKTPITVRWIAKPVHYEIGLPWSELLSLAVAAKLDVAARARLQNNFFSYKRVDDAFIDSLISQANRMVAFLSTPNHERLAPIMPVDGVETVYPVQGHSHFTGKILMLVNEQSFSAADLVAALFQDTQRATLFGSRTAGAGAYQNRFDFPANNPYSIIGAAIPFGMMLRRGGVPIQSFGVTPDRNYTVTHADLISGMADYRRAVLDAIGRL